MIGKTVSNILTSNSRFLYESQDKIMAVAKGRGQEKFGDKVPNVTDFKAQLESLRSEITTPENVEKAEKVFNRFLNICDSIINKTQASINELNNIKAKLDKILANKVRSFIHIEISFASSQFYFESAINNGYKRINGAVTVGLD